MAFLLGEVRFLWYSAFVMKTEILELNGSSRDAAKLKHAVRLLQSGALVAFPTETVYGLGADARNAEALARLTLAKGRPDGKPFSLLIPSLQSAEELCGPLPPIAQKLARLYWPGPLTMALPRRGGGSVGLRLPEHPVTRALLIQCGFPLAAPSANISGHPDPIRAEQVLKEMAGRIPLILDGGPAWMGKPSTVIKIENSGPPKVLRKGVITTEEIMLASRMTILFVCAGNTCRSPIAEVLCRHALKEQTPAAVPGTETGPGFRVVSAGSSAVAGYPADPLAQEVMREIGLDLSEHKTQALTPRLIDSSDFIFTMTRSQRESIIEWMPEARERVRLLSPTSEDIADPVSHPLEVYRSCRATIASCLREVLKGVKVT